MSDNNEEFVEVEFIEIEPSTELVPRETRTPSRIEGGMAHFEQYMLLADRIARTAMVPTALRGQPDQVLAVVMYGAELGIGPMQALQQINFIEGKPSMAPELMRALIREAGHKLEVQSSRTECVIVGTRGDTGEVGESEFTLNDAVQAGLCSINAEGNAHARSRDGKILPWEKYTKDMLLARATSRIARQMFSDVIAGMSYTPEEVESFTPPQTPEARKARGATKKASPTTTRRASPVEQPDMATDEEKEELIRAVAFLTDDEDREAVRDAWKFQNLPPVDKPMTSEQVQRALGIVRHVLNPASEENEAVEGADDFVAPVADENGEAVMEDVESIRVNPNDILPPVASRNKITQLNIKFGEAGFDAKDRETIHAYCAKVIGIPNVKSLNELTTPQVNHILEQLVADADTSA